MSIVGSLFAVFVAGFIMIACAATLYENGFTYRDRRGRRAGPRSTGGPVRVGSLCLGLLNASVFSAAILPLSTAYVVCEAFGLESGVEPRLTRRPSSSRIYTALIVLGAAVILLPIKSLVQAMLASQTLNGVLLP